MGNGMLLGILSGLSDILTKVFSWLLQGIIEKFIVPLIQLTITVVVEVFRYCFSAVFYEISKFLLGLVDFVEVLFRSLAGLPPTPGVDGTISIGGGGDLLLQLIRNGEVISTLMATAVVGVFLLIITTIFQMIKVEYTTEGANNSKSGIIGKSLKSLCNMIIIPLLVIFGVFIGNQVLDLIDTATGGGSTTRISGTLWVTAASSAMTTKFSEEINKYIKDDGDTFNSLQNENSNGAGLLPLGVSLAIGKGFIYPLETLFTEGKIQTAPYDDDYFSNNAGVEASFSANQEGFRYYKLGDVVKYYDPFEVNYLVLIFGACIIIKCLYHTCFGLIDRLYRCTALFIVMPMVVGMTPVKDSLGSWRQNFISRALSAYGTVISLNLFFIIVKVLLSVEITFGGIYAGKNWIFPSSFMSGLIKSIMVIVGCLMIEKLAGDMGNYFGGGNAMAEGKGLAKEATAGLTKAAMVAGGVAMGGVGIAAKLGKGAVSASHSVGAMFGKRQEGETFAQKYARRKSSFDEKGYIKRLGGAVDKGLSSQNNKVGASKIGSIYRGVKKGAQGAKKGLGFAGRTLGDIASGVDPIKAQAKRDKLKQANAKLTGAQYNKFSSNLFDKNGQMKENLSEEEKKQAAALQADVDQATAGVNSANEDIGKDKRRKSNLAAKVIGAGEGLGQMAKNKLGLGGMINTFAPKSISGLKKQIEDAQKQAMDTPEGKQMLANIEKQKSDEKEEKFKKRHSKYLDEQQTEGTILILNATMEKADQNTKETNDTIDKLVKALKALENSYNNTKDPGERQAITNNAFDLQSQIQQLNSAAKFEGAFTLQNDVHLKFDKASIQRIVEESARKGLKSEEIIEAVKAELSKMGMAGPEQGKIIREIYKQLQEIKSNLPNK